MTNAKYVPVLSDEGKVVGRKWTGPRGQHLTGANKQLARVAWENTSTQLPKEKRPLRDATPKKKRAK